MKVVIVSPWAIRFNHILRRMTSALRDELGWPVVREPQPGAFNYFFTYHAVPRPDGWDGPSAAYFSHDVGHPAWPHAAQQVSIRLATAPCYVEELAADGPSARIVPGVDLDFFAPNGRRPAGRAVGVSGVVYGDGRKGEDMVERLREEGQLDVEASGKGWPGGYTWRAWPKMPGFYRTLDVYLCASRVEGVPYPPLEALACGVKVVIPRGVGLLDELPDMPGIHRFDAGHYDQMRQAIDAALVADADPEALRAVVAARYTWDAWVDSHLQALAPWL